jgi:polysaccharide pyruvyl transferase WcaK-like protein
MTIIDVTPDSTTLLSMRATEDRLAGIDRLVSIVNAPARVPLKRWQWLASAISHKLTGSDERFYRYQYTPMIKHADSNTIALSIGGDNYCYGGVDWLYAQNKFLREKGAKTVLWGCSVEPSAMEKIMVNDLSRHAVITARETITFQAMQEKGLENVTLYPDPAFLLTKINLPLPEGFEEGNTVGINLSPLIMRYEKERGTAMKAYDALIRHILASTNMRVALIPHVTWKDNNDLEPLGELYDTFKKTGRVVLIGDHNAMELKGYIARCRMFIGARTHATIAAYSSHVPTVVVGYSIKARGIARDIFGDEKGHILPVQELDEPIQLITAFEVLKERETELRSYLENFMPCYSVRALDAVREIKDLISL